MHAVDDIFGEKSGISSNLVLAKLNMTLVDHAYALIILDIDLLGTGYHDHFHVFYTITKRNILKKQRSKDRKIQSF